MTEKKNQHYLPKFYLKNFSYNENGKQIGIFLPKNSFFHSTAPIKSQASKNFYYGNDGSIEDYLMALENKLSPVFKDILKSRNLPQQDSEDHLKLLCFVALTELRNPIKINKSNEINAEMNKQLLKAYPNIPQESLMPEISHMESVELSLSALHLTMSLLKDLNYKIIQNNSERCFITSDFPIIKYNQFLVLKRWPLSKKGNGLKGLQIFVPLNSKLMLVMYDASIYKIGDKKKQIVSIDNPEEIDQLNILQFLNNIEGIYFDHTCDKGYLEILRNKAKAYKRGHIAKADMVNLSKIETNLRKDSDLFFLGSSDIDINLELSIIRIHSKGKNTQLNSSAAQLRKWPEQLMKIQNLR